MLGYMRKFTYRSGHPVGAFRRSALSLLLIPLPLLLLWLWEGQLFWDLQGIPRQPLPDGTVTAMVAAHRIAGWMVPFVIGVIFGYGIARTEPDVRLIVTSERDVRRVWAGRWLPVGLYLSIGSLILAVILALWSGESVLRLATSTFSATLFSLAVSYAVVVWTGWSSGSGAFVVAIFMVLATQGPLALGLPPIFTLSPGPTGWFRNVPYHPMFLIHDSVVSSIAVVIAWCALTFPRDVRDLRWIAFYENNDA